MGPADSTQTSGFVAARGERADSHTGACIFRPDSAPSLVVGEASERSHLSSQGWNRGGKGAGHIGEHGWTRGLCPVSGSWVGPGVAAGAPGPSESGRVPCPVRRSSTSSLQTQLVVHGDLLLFFRKWNVAESAGFDGRVVWRSVLLPGPPLPGGLLVCSLPRTHVQIISGPQSRWWSQAQGPPQHPPPAPRGHTERCLR